MIVNLHPLSFSPSDPPIQAWLLVGKGIRLRQRARALKLVPEPPQTWSGPLGVGPCFSGPLRLPVQPGGDFEVQRMKLATPVFDLSTKILQNLSTFHAIRLSSVYKTDLPCSVEL